MHFILPRLALGAFDDVPTLDASHITHILTLCEACPSSEIPLLHRPIPDEAWLPPAIWQGLVEDISGMLALRQTVFVHCRLGVSRAPTAVAAYLIFCGYAPTDAMALIKEQRVIANPHPETWRGMMEWANGCSWDVDKEKRCVWMPLINGDK
jgi:hypothetical protein